MITELKWISVDYGLPGEDDHSEVKEGDSVVYSRHLVICKVGDELSVEYATFNRFYVNEKDYSSCWIIESPFGCKNEWVEGQDYEVLYWCEFPAVPKLALDEEKHKDESLKDWAKRFNEKVPNI